MAESFRNRSDSSSFNFCEFLNAMNNANDEIVNRFTDKKFLVDNFEAAGGGSFFASVLAPRKVGKIKNRINSHVEGYLKKKNLVDIETLMNSRDEVLIGKVFLGRLITGCMQWCAIHFVVEDPVGERAIRVSVYDWPLPQSLFSKGTIVAIVHPYFKTSMDGGLALRCDEPGDVAILTEDETKARFPNLKWRETTEKDSKTSKNSKPEVPKPVKPEDPVALLGREGNQYFAEGNYEKAIQKYSEGLSKAPDHENYLSNRAICHLKLENYELALNDALLCLKNNDGHLKAAYRAAKAYIGLKEYEKAKDLLETKLIIHPSNDDMKTLLLQTTELITQKTTGRYNMAKLYPSMGKSTFNQIADYTGPVEVYDTSSKGRGLRVTENVNPGQLLICCEPFAILFDPTSESDDMDEILAIEARHQKMVNLIVRKIEKQPETKRVLYELFAGKVLDRLNAAEAERAGIDIERIKRIFNINGIEHSLEDSYCFGLWILPSYINNDCINPNASLTLFGNVCQVRSFKPIKAGEEVLIAYHYHASPLFSRSLAFVIKDFDCQCALCFYERSEPKENRYKRENLLKKFENDGFRHPQKLRQIIRKIKDLSAGSPFADHYVAILLKHLAHLFFEKAEFKKALDVYSEFLVDWQRFGGDVTALLHKASREAFSVANFLGDWVSAKRFKALFLEHVTLMFGCSDDELLEEMYPGITTTFATFDAYITKLHV